MKRSIFPIRRVVLAWSRPQIRALVLIALVLTLSNLASARQSPQPWLRSTSEAAAPPSHADLVTDRELNVALRVYGWIRANVPLSPDTWVVFPGRSPSLYKAVTTDLVADADPSFAGHVVGIPVSALSAEAHETGAPPPTDSDVAERVRQFMPAGALRAGQKVVIVDLSRSGSSIKVLGRSMLRLQPELNLEAMVLTMGKEEAAVRRALDPATLGFPIKVRLHKISEAIFRLADEGRSKYAEYLRAPIVQGSPRLRPGQYLNGEHALYRRAIGARLAESRFKARGVAINRRWPVTTPTPRR